MKQVISNSGTPTVTTDLPLLSIKDGEYIARLEKRIDDLERTLYRESAYIAKVRFDVEDEKIVEQLRCCAIRLADKAKEF